MQTILLLMVLYMSITSLGLRLDKMQHPIFSLDYQSCHMSRPSPDTSVAWSDDLSTSGNIRVGPTEKQHNPWKYESDCRSLLNDAKDRQCCIYTSHSFAGGRGISVLTTPAGANTIVQTQAFIDPNMPDRVNKQQVPPYEARSLPGRGIGLIVNRTVYRGERLFSHTPVFIRNTECMGLHRQDRLALQRIGVERLPIRSRELFGQLHGQFGDDSVDDRINTNSFSLRIPGNDNVHFAVLPETSRINHDCRPNAHYFFSGSTLIHHVHALRTLHPGEELTISYLGSNMPGDDRKAKLLGNWGFKCSCALCTQPEDLAQHSDTRLRLIAELRDELADRSPNSTATPSLAELYVSLHQLENLLGPIADAYTYASLEYNGVGDGLIARKYAAMSIEAGSLYHGPDSIDVKAMQSVLLKPEAHWSWMFRKGKDEE